MKNFPSIHTFIHEMTILKCGFDTYMKILKRFDKSDVSKDSEFQRLFTGYYRLRRSKEWLSNYYSVFQKLRDEKDLSFEKVLSAIIPFSDGRIEISFASKMLATIRPDKPIWDKYIRLNLRLRDIGEYKSMSRIEAAITAYRALEIEFEKMLSDKYIQKQLSNFNSEFPDYTKMHPVKKLDFILWGCNRVGVADD